MVSGGASSSILLWDLETATPRLGETTYKPVGRSELGKSPDAHRFGITRVSFFPNEVDACLSSSYDHTLKIYTTETMKPAATFDLDSVVYSHAMSPVRDDWLIACGTQHSNVRLVDPDSRNAAQSLAGHNGAVLSVAWSPVDGNILASAGVDGSVRLWDIRRAAACLGVLDLDDSVGLAGRDGLGTGTRSRQQGRAHVGPANGVVWTDDARYLVTTGHDERARVWELDTAANTLAHFGPTIKNDHLSEVLPLIIPASLGQSHERVMMYPSGIDVLVFDLLEGMLIKRLRSHSPVVAQATKSGGQRNVQSRISGLAWRTGHVECYSAHTDGFIRAWKPRTEIDADVDREETVTVDESGDDQGRKRKRQALDDIFKDLTKQKITFT